MEINDKTIIECTKVKNEIQQLKDNHEQILKEKEKIIENISLENDNKSKELKNS
jgi:hypothetical protein